MRICGLFRGKQRIDAADYQQFFCCVNIPSSVRLNVASRTVRPTLLRRNQWLKPMLLGDRATRRCLPFRKASHGRMMYEHVEASTRPQRSKDDLETESSGFTITSLSVRFRWSCSIIAFLSQMSDWIVSSIKLYLLMPMLSNGHCTS